MNIQKMLKQAQEMQSRINDMQNKLAEMEMEGQAGGGAVKVVITGRHEARRVTISPELLKPDDKEMLEDLIVAAFNAARGNVESHIQSQMSEVTAGMSLPPGMKLPF